MKDLDSVCPRSRDPTLYRSRRPGLRWRGQEAEGGCPKWVPKQTLAVGKRSRDCHMVGGLSGGDRTATPPTPPRPFEAHACPPAMWRPLRDSHGPRMVTGFRAEGFQSIPFVFLGLLVTLFRDGVQKLPPHTPAQKGDCTRGSPVGAEAIEQPHVLHGRAWRPAPPDASARAFPCLAPKTCIKMGP